MLEKVGQYMQRPGHGIGIAITATGVTPEMVRVDFRWAGSSFFIANLSVTKSGEAVIPSGLKRKFQVPRLSDNSY
jgi:hypothetical protein